MNKISWLIYLSDVFETLKVLILFSTIVTLIIAIVCLGIPFVFSDEKHSQEKIDSIEKYYYSRCKRWFVVSGCFLVLYIFLPSQKTILSIAVSEGTEVVVKSDEAKQVFDLLKRNLAEKLK